eukprot:244132-Chlamydomonas_euryale.AAC.15
MACLVVHVRRALPVLLTLSHVTCQMSNLHQDHPRHISAHPMSYCTCQMGMPHQELPRHISTHNMQLERFLS